VEGQQGQGKRAITENGREEGESKRRRRGTQVETWTAARAERNNEARRNKNHQEWQDLGMFRGQQEELGVLTRTELREQRENRSAVRYEELK